MVTKREPVKYCTCISVGGLAIETAVILWGFGTDLAWVVATMMPLQWYRYRYRALCSLV